LHRDARQSPARVLAPLALALCTIAFLYVVISSGSSDDGGGGSTSAKTSTSERKRPTTTPQTVKRTYTVKTGDTLGGIAAKTGVSVEKLQELNPGLDPQALVSGQKIKLRE
jgi:peptidoglycan endopeptidase LytE